MAMEAIKGAGMTYQGSVSSAESQPKTDSAVKAAETDATEKGIVSETIKIIDKDTKKVLKEIPPEKTLDMIAKVWELAGLMVDEKR